ncbi:MAG: hypothetical protein Q7R80_02520 [bacterium]|nr:hypothetical protein [bacterium]
MDFMFAVVPFGHDGQMDELHGEVPNLGDFTEHLKDGVLVLKTKDEDEIPSPLGLSINITGIENVNQETGGAFLQLTNGTLNQRYVLLAPRREALDRLRAAIPAMGSEFRRKFLEVFVRNADAALERYGNNAAILIF